MIGFTRADRVGGQIRKLLAELLQKHISDPRLQMTTITAVKMTRDLKLARIYFITTGSRSEASAAASAFRSAHGFIKRNLARCLELRYMPELEFFYDDTFERAARIEDLLESLKTENGTDHSSH